jgi:RNA polymerase sigma factor (sigma-70 family)
MFGVGGDTSEDGGNQRLELMKDASFADVSAADLPWLRAFARRFAQGPDADDLVQDTILAAARARRPEVHSSRGWWAGVLRNTWRMRLRGDDRRRVREEVASHPRSGSPDASDTPEARAYADQIVGALRDALSDLDAVDRALLVARYVDERTATELAAEHRLPASTVRSRLSRARARVRGRVEAQCGGDPRSWGAVLAPLPGAEVSTRVGMFGSEVLVSSAGTKVAVAVGTVALAAGGWIALRPAADLDGPPAPVVEASSTVSSHDIETPAVVEPPMDSTAAKRQWAERLERIKAARSERLAAATERTDEPDPPSDGSEVERFRQELREAFAGFSPGVVALFMPLADELGSGIFPCLEDLPPESKSAGGLFDLRITLIGEPDVGTVVESVEMGPETNADPALVACARESVYTANLPLLEDALFDTLNLRFDLDERTMSLGTAIDAGNIVEFLERYPDLVSEPGLITGLAAEQPEVAEALRAAIAQDPSLTERYPELAVLIQSP